MAQPLPEDLPFQIVHHAIPYRIANTIGITRRSLARVCKKYERSRRDWSGLCIAGEISCGGEERKRCSRAKKETMRKMRAKNLKHLHMNLLNMSIFWPCRSENELAEAFQHAFRLPVNIQTAAHTWKIRLGHSMESQQFRLKPDHHRLHLQPKPEALFDGGGD